VALVAVAATLAVAGTGSASASEIPSVLGIPCTVEASGVQLCNGDLDHRVPSFDGVPLDTKVALPPATQDGPFPLIVALHGYGGDKNGTPDPTPWAQRGYAVLEYTARGFGMSCGLPPSRIGAGCAKGWIHLADSRFEARDTQHLAGLLADAGLVKPKKIGVTGISYGGGQAFELAALRNRIMRLNGKLKPWRSPDGTPMRIAAAAPQIGWTDLAYALVPNGNTLDFRARNPYGKTPGVEKKSFVDALYLLGSIQGQYASVGVDPTADITAWNDRIGQGEPYETPDIKEQLKQIKNFHSAYYVQRGLKRKKRESPAPILAYNSWADDLFPADESLRYYNLIRKQFPKAEFSMIFGNGFGHMRAGDGDDAVNTAVNAARDKLFDRRLLGKKGKPLGVETFTQACGGEPVRGPFVTRRWIEQTRLGIALAFAGGGESFDSSGGDPSVAAAIDPIGPGSSCRTTPVTDEPNSATFDLSDASGPTLLGSPTVRARFKTTGDFPQIDARLWDVGPAANEQTLVARGVYRPHGSAKHRQVFQLHPNGWHVADGHKLKLELLGRDPNYTRPSNGTFTVTVRDLVVELPTND
jgi:fermentation-respiration switch protein FrsA (DUF1100 family)